MKKISEWLSKNSELVFHALVGLIFWGSIFNAIFFSFFLMPEVTYLAIIPYSIGLIFGIIAKYRGWTWIN
tara:strand:- start:1962 stop:2171 length:210 start_codon:yes stop_codon:yes gene_type:complete